MFCSRRTEIFIELLQPETVVTRVPDLFSGLNVSQQGDLLNFAWSNASAPFQIIGVVLRCVRMCTNIIWRLWYWSSSLSLHRLLRIDVRLDQQRQLVTRQWLFSLSLGLTNSRLHCCSRASVTFATAAWISSWAASSYCWGTLKNAAFWKFKAFLTWKGQ